MNDLSATHISIIRLKGFKGVILRYALSRSATIEVHRCLAHSSRLQIDLYFRVSPELREVQYLG